MTAEAFYQIVGSERRAPKERARPGINRGPRGRADKCSMLSKPKDGTANLENSFDLLVFSPGAKAYFAFTL